MNHQDLFERICNNENLSSYRELEELLSELVDGIRDGFLPEMNLQGKALVRGAYLMDLLRMFDVVPTRHFRPLVELLKNLHAAIDPLNTPSIEAASNARGKTPARMSFYKNDPPGGHDEIAKKWGLQRGIYLSRLTQLLRYRSV